MAINFSDTTPAAPGGAVNVKWQQDGTGNVSAFTTAGAGTVSSVGLTMPPEFTVANSPVTAAGVIAVSKVNQAANLVYASPASGSGPPAFRALTAGDIPGAGAVSSVFGRTGAVVAASGDYTAAQITNAVDATGAYANPAWITSLAWSKITGAPAAGSQTPWLQNVDAAGFSLSNVPSISASAALTVAAGGAGALNLNTNAKTRLSIDSAGHVTINSPDNATQCLILAGTAPWVYAPNDNLEIRSLLGTEITGKTGVYLTTGSGAAYAQRLVIDSAGHVTINAVDDGADGIALNATGYIKATKFEAAGPNGYAVNAYFVSGSGWFYRANGTALVVVANAGNPPVLYCAASGTAGAAAGLAAHLTFAPGVYTYSNLAFKQTLVSSNALDAYLNVNDFVVTINSNTQLTFRLKGSDGVIRTAVMNLA